MTTKKRPVALITGGSSGMGKDFALRLLSAGYAVYGAARRIDRMRDIEGGGGVALEMDVTEDVTMVAAVDRIIREQGQIDVLINCAGYGQMGALEDVPVEVARRQLEVNLIGVARLTQLCSGRLACRRDAPVLCQPFLRASGPPRIARTLAYVVRRRSCGTGARTPCGPSGNLAQEPGYQHVLQFDGLRLRLCHIDGGLG
ncbi:hypothetical protein DNK06_12740 [Pseudomonas daroniae]|uniref:Short-chain dehydrogenase n=1 Tax=Phytopseudomonas daroniae TaxID=2487519 RepID=A0A4Q9QLQ2_9GAMM|nr:hypothetical protein DNK06_12740 [Pseudomonas daroniae]TBU80056.1 hypothetical protein DNK31_17595 [Pseudomonas sp. FRB 228]TBU91374.1 hypothetical protein DNJ99_10260 [Pseudomonas daroniae]